MLLGTDAGYALCAARVQDPPRAYSQPCSGLAKTETAWGAAVARCRMGAASHPLDPRAVPMAGRGDWRTEWRGAPVGSAPALERAGRCSSPAVPGTCRCSLPGDLERAGTGGRRSDCTLSQVS